MKLSQLINNIKQKKTYLCLGLDTDIDKIPKHLLKYNDPVYEFNKSLLNRLHSKIIAVKINTAFYESRGTKGWSSLEKTINYTNSKYPELFTIADAKRADIGNTSSMYAKAFFKKMNFDSITISPYMGEDSVNEFLKYKNKYVILLALTSNKGAKDFQLQNNLFLDVINKSKEWGNSNKLMYVVGATKTTHYKKIRDIVPNSFLLIPGVGIQGGEIREVINHSTSTSNNIIINISRAIIYSSSGADYIDKAEEVVDKYNKQINL